MICEDLGCPVEEYLKESLPFFAAIILLVILLIFMPNVVLWLPNLVYGG